MPALIWHPDALADVAYVIRYFILENGDVLITRIWHSREQRPL
ncbi:plasmid stabilization system protein ParE [Duganella sp. 1411]|jgi:plasmid stabilization system protein ParE|nr:hypothetical protein [Duganella sp. 1411]MBP1205634.1 plasmid stabilization system protein ParE [Duganella sp. 1411]